MLTCARCGQANQPDQRFCGNCGTPLTPPAPDPRRCLSCGHVNDAEVRFCTSCGKPLAIQMAARVNTPPVAPAYTPPSAIPPTIQVQLPAAVQIIAASGGGYACSQCGGFVRADAERCKHCKAVFGAPPTMLAGGVAPAAATQVTPLPGVAAVASKSGGSKTWLWIVAVVGVVMLCLIIGLLTLMGLSVEDALGPSGLMPIVLPFL